LTTAVVGSGQVEARTINYGTLKEVEPGGVEARAAKAPVDGGRQDVVSWVREKLGFEADAAQERVLSSERTRGILNCTRQWGKSTIAAAKAVHQAFTVGGSLTLAVSPSARQSGEFIRKVEGFAQRLGIRVKGDGENAMSVEFPNGARIIGLPGNEATIRGFSAVALLLVDEASRVNDELYLAIRPMLAVSNGSLWLMSTPYGKRGFFYEAWAGGGPDWFRVQVPAEECPRIPKAFLEEERGTMGDRWFRQEYQCEFVDSVSCVFDRDMLERAITDKVKPLVFR
jgi:phage FluMu gp28-like protein